MHFPEFDTEIRDGVLIAHGPLRPCALCDEYQVGVAYAEGVRPVVQVLDPANELDLVRSLGFPATGAPAVYLCVGKQCLAPIRSPGELRRWTRPGVLGSKAFPV